MTKPIKFFRGQGVPLEMHRTRVVQKLNLPEVDERLKALEEAGNNLYLLNNENVFLDMLTDSGVNAMSDKQVAAMMQADDAYAGSTTFYELKDLLTEIFGMDHFLPAHQGRACEHILAETFVSQGDVVPMNYHFTTTKAHIVKKGGRVEELINDEGTVCKSDRLFKGDMSIDKLQSLVDEVGVSRIPFVRLEAGTNLIGGQPISFKNICQVTDFCKKKGLMTVLDASLLQDNLYFLKRFDPACKDLEIKEITRKIGGCFDIIYFSGRKLGSARGGGICMKAKENWDAMKENITLYEGFLTYGGMSVKEMAAMTVGLKESLDFDMISQGPIFIEYMVNSLVERGIPVVTPAGGLGCHVDAMTFVDHIPGEEYPAAALASAFYLAGGVRTMERGTLSEDRNPDGSEHLASMELMRCAMPRRVFSMSHVDYAVDRLTWLFENRELISGLRFTEEPKTLRFFVGRLEPVNDWQDQLVAKFKKDFGDSL